MLSSSLNKTFPFHDPFVFHLQRIDVLIKQNRYQDALALGLSFYEGKAKAVVGLTGSQRMRKEIVANLVSCVVF